MNLGFFFVRESVFRLPVRVSSPPPRDSERPHYSLSEHPARVLPMSLADETLRDETIYMLPVEAQ